MDVSTSQIAQRYANTSNVKFPHDATRLQILVIIKNIDMGVRDCSSDWNRGIGIVRRVEAVNHTGDGPFGRTVFIIDFNRIAKMFTDRTRKVRLEVFTADDEFAKPRRRHIHRLDQGQMRWCQFYDVDGIVLNHTLNEECRLVVGLRIDYQSATTD